MGRVNERQGKKSLNVTVKAMIVCLFVLISLYLAHFRPYKVNIFLHIVQPGSLNLKSENKPSFPSYTVIKSTQIYEKDIWMSVFSLCKFPCHINFQVKYFTRVLSYNTLCLFPNSGPTCRWPEQSRLWENEQFGAKVEVSIPVASPLTIIKEHASMKTEER